MGFSSVLGTAWRLYARFFVRFVLLALVVFAVVGVVVAVSDWALDTSQNGQRYLLQLIWVGVNMVATYWLQGAMVFAVQDVQDGTFDSSTAEVFRRVRPHVGTLIGAGLLAGIGVGVGLLLIVPGLYLLAIWSLIAPSIVLEGRGIGESFGRSRALVRGHTPTVFLVVLATTLLSVVASGALGSLVSFLPRFLEILVGVTVASSIVAPFGAIAMTVMFLELRSAHGEHPLPPPS